MVWLLTTSHLWQHTLFERRGGGWIERRVRQSSPNSSFTTHGICNSKVPGQILAFLFRPHKQCLAACEFGAGLVSSETLPPLPCISAQGCTQRVWSGLWMCQHRAAARFSLTVKAQIWRSSGRKKQHVSHFPLPNLLPYHTRIGMPALESRYLENCRWVMNHPHTLWHSFTTNRKTTFILTSTVLYHHFSNDGTKASWTHLFSKDCYLIEDHLLQFRAAL